MRYILSNEFYVYIHRKLNGEVFYVGKGSKRRAFDKWGRSPHWNHLVEKYGHEVEILYKGLSEQDAFRIEEELIDILKHFRKGGTLINQTAGGAGSPEVHTSGHTRKLRSERIKGNNHFNADKTIYTFVHFYTKEEFVGTRQDFTTKKGFRIDVLFSKACLRQNVNGWCLKENIEKIERTKNDNRIHTFEHSTGRIIQSTRGDFRLTTGVDTVKLFANPPHRRNSVKGWCLGGNFDKIKLRPPLDQVYTFISIDGDTITTTRRGFKKKTGIDPSSLFRSGKHRDNSVQGWCLEGNLGKLRVVMSPSQVHTFTNVDGTTIKATRSEFKTMTGVETNPLFGKSKGYKITKGWSLAPQQTDIQPSHFT
jgi:hypothetical protein